MNQKEIVHSLEVIVTALEDSMSFFELFIKDCPERYDEKVEAWKEASKLLNYFQDDEVDMTKDTKRILKDGDGVFYIEGACEYYDSWLQMIKACFKSGMTKDEIRQALDIEDGGYIYWTEYSK